MEEITIHTPRCPHCFSLSHVKVGKQAYDNWKSGELIQKAFPYMSYQERELLQTGIHSDCWDKMFPYEED